MPESQVDVEQKLAREVGVPLDRAEFQRDRIKSAIDDIYSQNGRRYSDFQEEIVCAQTELTKISARISSIDKAAWLIAALLVFSVAKDWL